MLTFEVLLALMLGATILSTIAQRARIPYPTLLALGGAAIALIPGAPRLSLAPELILALFVAPVLLDAAHDTSLRDLRQTWRPVLSLVLVAVGLTTFAVAVIAHQLFPNLPWAAGIALGALLAPPDAVAALAVLRQVALPHRIRKVLEGESLLNDASALLIYKLAVGAAAVGSFSPLGALPTFATVVVGSAGLGFLLAWPVGRFFSRIADASTSVILQFVTTFSVWLLAEHLGLSAVVTMVVFGLTVAQASLGMPARLRVPSFAIWETATFVLNVLAFTLIGLQIGPIVGALNPAERVHQFGAALAILAVVLAVRLFWAMAHHFLVRGNVPLFSSPRARSSGTPPTWRGALVVGWSGMRGIVTLGAALALPSGFPFRDFIQLTAFVVVLGTLVIQGLTLRPLLALLRLPLDTTVETEINLARSAALKAALQALQNDETLAAERLRLEYGEALSRAQDGGDPYDTTENTLRQRVVPFSRRALYALRDAGTIGDDAYRVVEAELDRLELSSSP